MLVQQTIEITPLVLLLYLQTEAWNLHQILYESTHPSYTLPHKNSGLLLVVTVRKRHSTKNTQIYENTELKIQEIQFPYDTNQWNLKLKTRLFLNTG